MKLTNPMRALLAGAMVLSCGGEPPPATESGAPPRELTVNPIPFLGYVAADMGALFGGAFGTPLAIGNSGRAVGEAEGCVPFMAMNVCRVSPVYWDPGQPPVVIPSLPGMLSGRATGITDAGVIVGSSVDTSNHSHGWRWSAGTGTQEVLAPDGSPAVISAAASNGWTTGIHYPPGKLNSHAFRYSVVSGHFDDLFPASVPDLLASLGLSGLIVGNNTDGLVATIGTAVDVIGNVAGTLKIGVNQYRLGYVWPGGGGSVDLHALNTDVDVQEATAINGTVVGPYIAWNGTERTYSWIAGGLLGDMGVGASAHPLGLSSLGRLVGRTTTGTPRPLTWYINTLTYLPTLGGHDGQAIAVNRCGTVVGYALDASSRPRPLRWTKSGCDG
jgi:hypothetical protein